MLKLEDSLKSYVDNELWLESVITDVSNLSVRLNNAEIRAADLLHKFQAPKGTNSSISERLQHLDSGQVAGSVSFAD